uniref:Uncharacterized protein n=1 Tax=Rhizophora mucronata TaxID=61149 RepID=A0A2P2PGY7_RHIMU
MLSDLATSCLCCVLFYGFVFCSDSK